MQFQWYPGHMTKARRQMQEDIKLIDLMIELVDARVPLSSRNPDIDGMGRGKSRIILLNKADLADEKYNQAWKQYYAEKGMYAVRMDSRNRSGVKNVQSGILNRPVRAMVVGIPNVGKSTFINSFAGKACAKTGNKPGVTKGRQWIKLNKNVELLDTPGILWPKFEDQAVGMHLAFIGSMNDELINQEELSLELISVVTKNYPGVLEGRYAADEASSPVAILGQVAASRHCLKKGGEYDTVKAAAILLDDFRCGRLGRITIEAP